MSRRRAAAQAPRNRLAFEQLQARIFRISFCRYVDTQGAGHMNRWIGRILKAARRDLIAAYDCLRTSEKAARFRAEIADSSDGISR